MGKVSIKKKMKKQRFNQIMGVFLTSLMLLSVSSVAVFANNVVVEDLYQYVIEQNEDDYASVEQLSNHLDGNIPIIVIPGIAGTEMRNPENSVLQLVWINILWHFQGHLEQLALDQHGLPVVESVHPVSTGYGANNTYQTLLRELRREFGNERVLFWGYDWRLDNAYNALRLNDFINSLNVPAVNIVAHSMGGLIVSRYIADGHGDRINTLITLGTPFLGSPRVPYIFATGNLVEVPLLPGPRNGVRNVSSHMLSAYQMLPFESPYRYIAFGQRTGMLWWSELEWEPVPNERDFIRDLLPMRGVENSQVPPSVRAGFLTRAPHFIASTFINGVHAMETVNSHVIIGENIPTVHTTVFNRNGDFIENLHFTRGDGTVPVWSQTINGRVNTISFNYDHTALTSRPRVISQIVRLIRGVNATVDGDVVTDNPFVVLSATSSTEITVSRDGETLSSTEDHFNTMTNFGTLHFIGPDEETKILALRADHIYDVLITGTSRGTTDYTIRFYDSNFELIEARGFLNVPISYGTIITTTTNQEDGTTLVLTSGRNRSFVVTLQPDYIYTPETGPVLFQPQ